VLARKTDGEIQASWIAQDAPWHYAGPTDIRPGQKELIPEENDARLSLIWEKHQLARIKLGLGMSLDAEEMADVRKYISSKSEMKIRDRIITQEIKQADMPLIPHPFIGYDPQEYSVLLLDPVSELSAQLRELQSQGVSIANLIHNGFFKIGSSRLSRVSPPGVNTVTYRWK